MLQKIGFQPGFNKQITETTAEGQWVGGDNVRFRYGTPEKIGGWAQLGENKLTGAARAMHHIVNNSGTKFAIIGTNRILYAYTGGIFYDISPIKTTTTLTNAFTTVNGSTSVTITFSTDHGINVNDIILLDNFTAITGSDYTAADFDDKKFMVTSIPTATTLTITMPTAETGAGATLSGGIRVQHYYPVGPSQQLPGFGYGLGQWGGTVSGEATTTLVNSINAVQTTGIQLTDSALFPTSGTNYIQIGTEEISYTGITSGVLSGVTRGVRNTTAATHNAGDTITNTTDYIGWGEAASGDFVVDPGEWSIDNFGAKVIALIHDAQCFEWDSNATDAVNNRATLISGAPTASRDMLVSTPDRHLVFFGTETTIGDPTTQDLMFIRFSDQENINEYAPTSVNTAGTQRLSDGSRIVGAVRGRDAIYVWTDTSLFTMRFVGAPFTFGFAQVGTNCGLIGESAAIEVDGAAYWMSENGFFKYSGNLESMVCLVEDYVYNNLNTTASQLINAGLNNLFGEITWFYCTGSSTVVNACVTYNYIESSPQRPIWTTGTLARTTWVDSAVFGLPHATQYNAADNSSFDVIGNTDGSTIYYEHEKGTDEALATGVNAIISNIESGDFDIGQQGLAGDGGEYIMKVRRFIPDFLSQTGNTQITLQLRNYSNDAYASSPLGPFTITSSTDKVDTRARGRAMSLKIANTGSSQSWKLGTFRLDVQPDGRR
ncbi:hypothetical protein OAU51_00450 [Porticoccaceae bacterium]|nr:hypothetical protein [Porticoccaceae bacterium]